MKKTFLTTITLFVLAACTSSGSSLAGGWKLVSHGDAADPAPAISDVDTFINFDSNGEVSGNVGCNSFSGNYEVSGDTIVFRSIMSTMMYCEKTSAQEQAVLRVFSDNVKLPFQMSSDTLTITSADGTAAVTLTRK